MKGRERKVMGMLRERECEGKGNGKGRETEGEGGRMGIRMETKSLIVGT